MDVLPISHNGTLTWDSAQKGRLQELVGTTMMLCRTLGAPCLDWWNCHAATARQGRYTPSPHWRFRALHPTPTCTHFQPFHFPSSLSLPRLLIRCFANGGRTFHFFVVRSCWFSIVCCTETPASTAAPSTSRASSRYTRVDAAFRHVSAAWIGSVWNKKNRFCLLGQGMNASTMVSTTLVRS